MRAVAVKDLIDAGVHFGHRISRWNPAMRPYIFGTRNQIHIIDLRHTVRGLIRATNFMERLVASGREVLFVGTKRQAKGILIREAKRCGVPYVAERWLGGTLTNFHTIRSRLNRLQELELLEATGEIDRYSKKMISSLRRQLRKLRRNLDGIRTMKDVPSALFVVDVRKEVIAVREANKLGIPVIALTDTDSDPAGVDIMIPGNDDAFRAIEVIVAALADAAIGGKDKMTVRASMAEKAETAPKPEEPAAATAAGPVQAVSAEPSAEDAGAKEG
ncbi:MAG: 30S ribosomal protein S2 [Planctomycetes bacterium]|nr:30S ribosomal protein S2 [Planctomycetota bacterium]